MVISLVIAKHDVKKILVDNGSSVDILFYDAFQSMMLPSHRLPPINASLVKFTRNSVQVDGVIALLVTAGKRPRHATKTLTFLVVWVPSAYNAILSRPSLNAFQAIVSTYHLLLKFSTPNEIDEVCANQMMACADDAGQWHPSSSSICILAKWSTIQGSLHAQPRLMATDQPSNHTVSAGR